MENSARASVARIAAIGWIAALALLAAACDDGVAVVPAPGCEGALSFADPNLEQAVRGAVGKTSGALYAADVAGLTTFTPSYAGVRDLDGIQCLSSLQELDLSGDPVTGLAPLADLDALAVLWLFDTGVSDLAPLAEMASLTDLYLSGGPFDDLAPLAESPSLEALYVLEAQVGDLSQLAAFTSLKTLGLGDNEIVDLSPLAGLASLGYLHVDGNAISDLSPLVANAGVAACDVVLAAGNPVDATAQQANIDALCGRCVFIDCFCEHEADLECLASCEEGD